MISPSIFPARATTAEPSCLAMSFTFCTRSLLVSPGSMTLQIYKTDLALNKVRLFANFFSSSVKSVMALAGIFLSMLWINFLITSICERASLSPDFASFSIFVFRRSRVSISEIMSSVLIVSISEAGSIVSLTWGTLPSSKQRTTCAMASTSRIWPRNLFPKPSPLEAPLISPAISTNSIVVGTIFLVWIYEVIISRRLSGTGTMPLFGSMVVKA